MLTSDPTVRAVFVEDAAAIAGDAIAFVGVWLHHRTGSSVYEGIAAIVIGVLLMTVGLQLARRNRDFLLGEHQWPHAFESGRSSRRPRESFAFESCLSRS